MLRILLFMRLFLKENPPEQEMPKLLTVFHIPLASHGPGDWQVVSKDRQSVSLCIRAKLEQRGLQNITPSSDGDHLKKQPPQKNTDLARCNSHIIKFSCFKYTIQCFSVNLHRHTTIITTWVIFTILQKLLFYCNCNKVTNSNFVSYPRNQLLCVYVITCFITH